MHINFFNKSSRKLTFDTSHGPFFVIKVQSFCVGHLLHAKLLRGRRIKLSTYCAKFNTLNSSAICKSTVTLPSNSQSFAAHFEPSCRTQAPVTKIENRSFRCMFLPYSQRNATREGSYKRTEGPASASLVYIVYSIRFSFDNITQCC